MGLFSFPRKNKQESTSGDSEFQSRTEEVPQNVRGRGRRRQTAQGSDPADPVLPQKKRARRRLVGALALVLAAVIGLPMILDSEPKPLADDISIQIPSKDKPPAAGSQQRAVVAPVSTPATPVSTEPKEPVVEAPAAGTAALPATAAAGGAVVVAGAVALAGKSEPAKETGKTPEAVKKTGSEKSIASAPVAATAAAKAEHKPETKPETKPEPKAETKTEAKTEAAVGKAEVKAPKAPAHASDKKESGAAVADDGARAKAILEGKSDEKLQPAVASADKKSGKFVLQVAALATKAKIDELQGKLKKAGITSYTQKVATQSGERTRIRVGPFATKDEMEKMRARLNKLGLNGTLVQ